MHPARAWRNVGDKVVCQLCYHFCKLKEGEFGRCNARFVRNGNLYTLTYGNVSAMESRPMEIKPFFHFLPGKTAITFSTYSCNLDCPWCQNWHLSKVNPPMSYSVVKPEEIVEKPSFLETLQRAQASTNRLYSTNIYSISFHWLRERVCSIQSFQTDTYLLLH